MKMLIQMLIDLLQNPPVIFLKKSKDWQDGFNSGVEVALTHANAREAHIKNLIKNVRTR